MIITTRNINTAVNWGLRHLLKEGVVEESRNGQVIVAPEPVMTVYERPQERVLFSPTRDANPFFHLMEALWMLAGHHDVEFPVQFNKRFAEYSDDGRTIWGAYGFRWREFFGVDQLNEIIDELKRNPNTRRAVLGMWSPYGDLTPIITAENPDGNVGGLTGKDVPCNTHAYFDVRNGKLNMTVCCRSNDAVWGAYGANVVHFSMLLEYIAENVGVPMGVYRQFSNNFHAYLDIYEREKLTEIAEEASRTNLYNIYPDMKSIPLGSLEAGWEDALLDFLDGGTLPDGDTPTFFKQVAYPMLLAWRHHKDGDSEYAITALEEMPYCDWQVAGLDWIKRRQKGKKNAA